MNTASLLTLILALPFLAAVGVVASRTDSARRDRVSLGAGVLLFLLVATLAMAVSWDSPPHVVLASASPAS